MAVYKDKNKTKDGRCWFYKVYKKNFEGNNVPYKSKRYLTKKECEEAEALFLLKRDNTIKNKFDVIGNAFLDNCYKTKKESTAFSYEGVYNKNIKPYFKNRYIDEITIKDITIWQETLQSNNYKISYLSKCYHILKMIFDFGMKYYNLNKNVVSICGNFKSKNDVVIKDDNKLKYITLEQFNKLVSIIDDSTFLTIIYMLFYGGMRKSELLALTFEDVDLNNNIIKINKTISFKSKTGIKITSTKNNLNRVISINNKLHDVLNDYIIEMKKYEDYEDKWFLFGGSRTYPLTNMDRLKSKYFKLAELEEITFHEFRHSHVSLLINEYIKKSKEKNMKVDMSKFFLLMSGRLGHTIEVMQKTYMHLFPNYQDEIVDLLNNL